MAQHTIGRINGSFAVQPQRSRLAASASSAALSFLKTASTMLAARITSVHFSVSSAMSLPNLADQEPGRTPTGRPEARVDIAARLRARWR